MVRDPETDALRPASYSEFQSFIPELSRNTIKVEMISLEKMVDSADVDPDLWLKMAQTIADNYDAFDGFVILHGTDTMAYSASALSFMLENLNKPVVFTGSQLPIGVLRTDARENLQTAIEIAAAHDEEGNLVINPEEEPTVKLMFYMYLYGYSTQQIADTLIALGRRSYLGNIKWTANGVVQVLRNERHCGQVLTRKTWTPNFRDHKAKKNRGDRPQSRYSNHHEPIISRDNFIAVQQLLDNAKYRNKSVLPELRVIDSGLLRGFVTINPRWAGFKADDYLQAAMSAYESTDLASGLETPEEYTVEVAAGDFDLRGFEIARSEFFDPGRRPFVTFHDKKIKFSAACVRQFKSRNMIELLVNPLERKFAIRATGKDNRRAVQCSTWDGTDYYPRDIAAAAFSDTLYELFGWKTDYKYRIIGSLIEKDNDIVFLFNAARSEAYFDSYLLPVKDAAGTDGASVQPLLKSGRRIRAIPKEWATSFGQNFYYSEQSLSALEQQSEADWKLHIQGRLYDSGKQIKITGFDELHSYISQELKPLKEDAECRKE